MAFAHLGHVLNLVRLRLGGSSGARDVALLAAIDRTSGIIAKLGPIWGSSENPAASSLI